MSAIPVNGGDYLIERPARVRQAAYHRRAHLVEHLARNLELAAEVITEELDGGISVGRRLEAAAELVRRIARAERTS
jgi:hypothetical protein